MIYNKTGIRNNSIAYLELYALDHKKYHFLEIS